MSARLLIGGAALLAAAFLGAVLFGGPVVGYFKGRTHRAEATAETQTDQAVSAGETLQAERNLGRQALDLSVTIDAARDRTDQLKDETYADDTSEAPLDRASIDRLRGHDDWLCEQRPALCADRGPAPD